MRIKNVQNDELVFLNAAYQIAVECVGDVSKDVQAKLMHNTHVGKVLSWEDAVSWKIAHALQTKGDIRIYNDAESSASSRKECVFRITEDGIAKARGHLL